MTIYYETFPDTLTGGISKCICTTVRAFKRRPDGFAYKRRGDLQWHHVNTPKTLEIYEENIFQYYELEKKREQYKTATLDDSLSLSITDMRAISNLLYHIETVETLSKDYQTAITILQQLIEKCSRAAGR